MFFSDWRIVYDVHPPPLRRSVAGLEFDGLEPLHESVGRRGLLFESMDHSDMVRQSTETKSGVMWCVQCGF